ncbi:hypothetical protein CA11_04240 [Gimesia maris]|jgi:hypothetical protein|nr:hypothetical protein Mal35_04290 [Gimesia maris]QDU12644.1 hypothetical protein CA11_04240 [Gimesia maris]
MRAAANMAAGFLLGETVRQEIQDELFRGEIANSMITNILWIIR